ncbi:MAG: hypothetical protein CR975_01630 [Gammaproteobacteria bacterium]|nr:MAG: hypothetical protein CR975_01630 [Gammaproteobacteria bacterium]
MFFILAYSVKPVIFPQKFALGADFIVIIKDIKCFFKFFAKKKIKKSALIGKLQSFAFLRVGKLAL